MNKAFRDLMASAKVRRFRDEQAVDRWLNDQQVQDPETRIAVKHSLEAQGKLATDRVRDTRLATDTAVHAPSGSHLQRLMDRAGIRPLQSYDEFAIDALLKTAGIDDIETRVMVKTELRTRGQLH